ncbi:MAG: DEAD/DEAH box helicase [Actinomycetes bacterium]
MAASGEARPVPSEVVASGLHPRTLATSVADQSLSPAEQQWAWDLLPYQLNGVLALLAGPNLLLADDMGLGKTVQAIVAIRVLAARGLAKAVLIVVPASLTTQWRRELRVWAPDLSAIVIRGAVRDRAWQWRSDANVVIVSYETLRSDLESGSASPPQTRHWDIVVLDEAQKIKNRQVEISGRIKSLNRTRSWALTGTPLENRIEDLSSILDFVDPVSTRSRTWNLFDRHAELQLRRRKADVLKDLPPKRIIDVPLEMTGSQRESYDRVQQLGLIRLRAMGPDIRVANVLELITRLKQVCNFDPVTRASVKLDDISMRLTALVAEGHRALVFSQFTDDRFGVEAVAARLAAFRPLSFTGALSTDDRDRVTAEFKADRERQALVLSLRAGAFGLNLQDASYVFHMDRWWNPAIERQAEDRSHRLGQQAPVTCYRYTIENTVEERIDQILRSKQQLFDTIVDDVSLDLTATLSREEIFSLFGL